VRNLEVLAVRKNITVIKQYDGTLPLLPIDGKKIEQVFMNVLSNALKFTTEGGKVEITSQLNNGMVEVAIADNGVGMSQEELETLFERYRQTQSGLQSDYHGTGLGLVISKLIVEAHGGTISAQSRVGQGSRFMILLPIEEQQPLIQ
jgi:signal transduction histidine kinase